MTQIISNGDTVRDTCDKHTSIALNHGDGLFVAVFTNYIYGKYAIIFDKFGQHGDRHVVDRVDHAQAVWDALDPSVRSVLKSAEKIPAIKALRALTMPMLSLTDAKRAIETFAA